MKKEELTALGLTEDQATKVFELHGKELTKTQTERDGYKTQLTDANARLTEANTKLAGYDPEWKAKADQAQKDADSKVAASQYQAAAFAAVSGIKFTSEGAKKAFLTDLTAKKLPLQDDKMLGLDDFVTAYKKTDPGAFAGDTRPPAFSGPTPGPAQGAQTNNDKVNSAIREVFGHPQQTT